ncbi:MAG: rod shape-determining protein [Arsenophonus sp.]|nr:MAG: rod shape-determining protein [Arsenophonus sp.]
MFKKIRSFFTQDLSIDLGTANTLIYIKEKGIVLNEPSVVAIKKNKINLKTNIVAIGYEAKRMLGRTPNNIYAIRPMKDGVIADFDITEKMLQFFIRKVHKKCFLCPRPRILVCVPIGATQVEKRAIRESVLHASNVREVLLISEPMAAAIGVGLPIYKAKGSMIVDIGGGTTEVAVISLNGIVYSSSTRIGGDKFNESIINYVRRQYGILIGETTAEKIKHKIGCAIKINDQIKKMEIRGRNVSEGIPRSLILNSTEVIEALKDPIMNLINLVKCVLEKCPPELASDVSQKGIVLTGGSSLLRNFDHLFMNELKMPVIVDVNPLTSVVRGGGKALQMFSEKNSDFFIF